MEPKTRCYCCADCVQVSELHVDREAALRRACGLADDPEARESYHRLVSIINHYMGLAKGRIDVRETPYLSILIELLGESLRVSGVYEAALVRLLCLCQKVPLSTRHGASQQAVQQLGQYFTALGNTLLCLEDESLKALVLGIVLRLVSERPPEEPPDAAPLRLCQEALVESQIPQLMPSIVELISEELYEPALNLLFQVCLLSTECSKIIIRERGVETLVYRVPVGRCPGGEERSVQDLTRHILWKLLQSSFLDEFTKLEPISLDALRNLDQWLRWEVARGDPSRRNDVAALISRLVFLYPRLELVKSGLMDDVCLLGAATELGGLEGSWAEGSRLIAPSPAGLEFKQILLTILCQFSKYPSAKILLAKHRSLDGLLLLLAPLEGGGSSPPWTLEQRLALAASALHALPFLAEEFRRESQCADARDKLASLLDCFTFKCFTPSLLLCSAHCLFALSLRPNLRPLLKDPSLAQTLLLVSDELALRKGPLTLAAQRSLVFLYASSAELQVAPGSPAVASSALVLERLLNPQETDSKIDKSLFIALGDYVWQCIVLNEDQRRTFIDSGGVFLVIDAIHACEAPVKLLYLGVLADLAEDPRSGPELAAWRGGRGEGGGGLAALLCDVWRRWEAAQGVKRTPAGAIQDAEEPLVSDFQRGLGWESGSCPPIGEAAACLRPKVFALFNLLPGDLATPAEVAGAPTTTHDEVTSKDKITYKIIEYYGRLKEGEIWWEMFRKAKGRGRDWFLPLDASVLEILTMRLVQRSRRIRIEQESVRRLSIEKEEEDEKELYERLKLLMSSAGREGADGCARGPPTQKRATFFRDFQQL